MDRERALELLKLFERPMFKTPKGSVISFARQDMGDIEEIEEMSDGELIRDWKGLVWLNYIYGQVDLNEMQRIQLIELEMDVRPSIDTEKLGKWFDKFQDEYDKMIKIRTKLKVC